MKQNSEKNTMTRTERLKAIWGVMKLSFSIAPSAIVFKLFGAVLNAVLPIITTYFAALTASALVEAYSGADSAGSKALRYIVITACLGLAYTIWWSANSYVESKMRYVVEARISDKMYRQFLSLEFWRYDDKETIDLYDKAIQFSRFFVWVFDRISELISKFVQLVSAIAALAIFQPTLAIVVMIGIIPGLFIQFRISKKQIKHWNENVEIRRAKSMLESRLSEVKTISELRLYGIADYLMKYRRKLHDTDELGRLKFEKSFIPLRVSADVLEALIELGSLVWIAGQIVKGSQPVGQFLYVQQIVSRAISGASAMASDISNIDEDIANLFYFQRFMALPIISKGGIKLKDKPEKIEFKNVSFKYTGSDNLVIDNLSLEINLSQKIAIVGENGAGKSTFIKILTGLYKPTKGKVLIDGVDMNDIDIVSWHKLVGVLQQDFVHYIFATAKDNVRFGDINKIYSEENLNRALKLAEADKFVAKLPQGSSTYVSNWMEDSKGNKGVDLSGGQWQRLALARDFYRDAPFLILDEPTSAIDAIAEARIFDRLFKDNKKTLVVVSHRLSTIERADRIYMFKDGKIAEYGTHKELEESKSHYYQMFKSQIKK